MWYRDLLLFSSGIIVSIGTFYANKYVISPIWNCYKAVDKKIENKYKDL